MSHPRGLAPPIVPGEERRALEGLSGPAYHAEHARQVLGITRDQLIQVAIPPPVFQVLVAVGVGAAAVIGRPQAVGMRASLLLDAALALVLLAAVLHHDRVVCPPEARPGLDGTALPVAGLLAIAVAAGSGAATSLRVAGLLGGVAVIGAVPHLAALRTAGQQGPWLRLLREVAGIVVLAPVLLAGVDSDLAPLSRMGLVALATALVTTDALRVDDVAGNRAGLAGVAAGFAVAVAAVAAGAGGSPGARTATLLVVWYGLRGIAGDAAAGRWGRSTVIEYTLVLALAAVLIQVTR